MFQDCYTIFFFAYYIVKSSIWSNFKCKNFSDLKAFCFVFQQILLKSALIKTDFCKEFKFPVIFLYNL